jgi:hypothetical protein
VTGWTGKVSERVQEDLGIDIILGLVKVDEGAAVTWMGANIPQPDPSSHSQLMARLV